MICLFLSLEKIKMDVIRIRTGNTISKNLGGAPLLDKELIAKLQKDVSDEILNSLYGEGYNILNWDIVGFNISHPRLPDVSPPPPRSEYE